MFEKPVELLLKHPEIDFPFFVAWACLESVDNKDTAPRQECCEVDSVQFIMDLKQYIEDPRYMRIDNKPVIGIYSHKTISNFEQIVAYWREIARNCGIGEIVVWSNFSDAINEQLSIEASVDGYFEFLQINEGYCNSKAVTDSNWASSYDKLIQNARNNSFRQNLVPIYRASILELDDSTDTQLGHQCSENFSIEKFYLWNCINTVYTRTYFPPEQRFIFINVQNKSVESPCFEPNQKYGYAAINALSKAIMDLPFNGDSAELGWKSSDENSETLFLGGVPQRYENGWEHRLSRALRIAIQVHAFYPDIMHSICQLLNNIPFPYDLYVTTTEKYKATYIADILEKNCNAANYYIEIVSNKGRDVLPLIKQLSPVIDNYDYFCHIHTKKSLHSSTGNAWRDYLYDNLLGSENIVRQILFLFENQPDLGIIFAENPEFIRHLINWGPNKYIADALVAKLDPSFQLDDEVMFAAGNMFWARTNAVKELLLLPLDESYYPDESGQLDETVMHAIERLWIPIAQKNGYTYQIIRNLLDNFPL